MLSNAQEKLILSLHTKKGREKSGLCLVEGEKVIHTAGDAIEYTFSPEDTFRFRDLVTTETPQQLAAVARIPQWTQQDIQSKPTLVVLDGVQDPGNVGSILRLCLGFNAALLLIDSVDVTNSKVVRSSVGALFHVPWITMNRDRAVEYLTENEYTIYRLEKTDSINAASIDELEEIQDEQQIAFIAGSEGQGIQLETKGYALSIDHHPSLESLNVTHALAIVLHKRYNCLTEQSS